MLIKDPPVKITDNLMMLGSNEYPIYLFKGEKESVIFEGGTGAMGPVVLEQFKSLGINSDQISQLIITHGHPDHVMAVPFLKDVIQNLSVSASRGAAKTLSIEKAVAFFCKIDGALTNALTKSGVITESQHPVPLEKKSIPVDQIISAGDVISVEGEASFKVLETPGHSDCSLSFHEPALNILIISDAAGYYIPECNYSWPNYFTSFSQYISSLETLRTCNAEILCLSHNCVIRGIGDVNSFLSDTLSSAKDYHERIITDFKSGRSAKEISGQLGSEVYEKTQLLPLDFFQKNCSLLVKESLKHEGIEEE